MEISKGPFVNRPISYLREASWIPLLLRIVDVRICWRICHSSIMTRAAMSVSRWQDNREERNGMHSSDGRPRRPIRLFKRVLQRLRVDVSVKMRLVSIDSRKTTSNGLGHFGQCSNAPTSGACPQGTVFPAKSVHTCPARR